MEDSERKKVIRAKRAEIRGLTGRLGYLIHGCPHNLIIKSPGNSAICDVCRENFGWWCSKSTTKYCHYPKYDPTHPDNYEYCIYCHLPEERK
jgi:hypothetical protein